MSKKSATKALISFLVVIILISTIGTIVVYNSTISESRYGVASVTLLTNINNYVVMSSQDTIDDLVVVTLPDKISDVEPPFGTIKNGERTEEHDNSATYVSMFEYLDLTPAMKEQLEKLDRGESNHLPNYDLIDFMKEENHFEQVVLEGLDNPEYNVSNSTHEVYPPMSTPEASQIVDDIMRCEGVDTCELHYWEVREGTKHSYNWYRLIVNNKCFDIFEQYNNAVAQYSESDTELYCK